MWKDFKDAPKDGTKILVKEMGDLDNDVYLTFFYRNEWTVEAFNQLIPLGECKEFKATINGKPVMIPGFEPTHYIELDSILP